MIIGVIAIAVVSTYSFYTFKKALLSRTFDQLTSVRVVKKGQIEQFFQDRMNELKLISNTYDIDNLKKDRKENTRNKGQNYLWEHLRASRYYECAVIEQQSGELARCNFNDSKVIRFEYINLLSQDPLNNILKDQAQSEYFIIHDYNIDPVTSKKRMFISGPLLTANSGRSLKVILEISLEAINAIMLEQNPGGGLGLSGESYLVGQDELMRSNSRFQENSIMVTQVKTEGVKKAFNNTVGTSVIDDYRGIKVLSSYSKINLPGLNWVILSEIDYAEATKSIYIIRNNILILTIFVAVVVFIISFIFSKRITLPLIKLNEATTYIRRGNLNVKLPQIKNDEIGQLTNSFNDMASSLREKDTELQQERNKRFTAMIDGQELERQRLSRELHDGLGQSLIALKLKLEGIDGKDVCNTGKTIKEVKTSFDETINEIRRISNNLMPAVLKEFGLITALKNICDDISENTTTEIRCTHSGRFNDLNDRSTIYLFRIMQEALSNIVKHAEAKIAEVSLKKNPDSIIVNITDNGKGINPPEENNLSGNGIPNMRERIRLLQGNIEIKSLPGQGTSIRIEVPLNSTTNESD